MKLVKIDDSMLKVIQICERLGTEKVSTTYGAGEAFGEKSLQAGNNPRSGSCKSITDTYCAIVEKDIYLKVLNQLNLEKTHRMYMFLK